MTIAKQSPLEAAKAVLTNLDIINTTEFVTEGDFHIAECQWLESIEALRQAVAKYEIGDAMQERELQDEPEVYKPITLAEWKEIWKQPNYNNLTLSELAERIVVERLGLKWGEK